jgi:hypothetical protein
LCIPSGPWLRHPGHHGDPSTHPQIHRGPAESVLGHNRVGLPASSEAGLGDHKPYIRHADISCGYAVRGYPTPGRQCEEALVGINQQALRRDGTGTHFIYQVDKGLSINSRETFDRLHLIAIREDGRYQGDVLVRGRGRTDQPFPEWRVTAHEEAISSTNT